MKAFIQICDAASTRELLRVLEENSEIKAVEVAEIGEVLFRKKCGGWNNGDYTADTYEPVTHRELPEDRGAAPRIEERSLGWKAARIGELEARVGELEQRNAYLVSNNGAKHKMMVEHENTINRIEKENAELRRIINTKDEANAGLCSEIVELRKSNLELREERNEIVEHANKTVAELRKSAVVWVEQVESIKGTLNNNIVLGTYAMTVYYGDWQCTLPLPYPPAEKDKAEEAWEKYRDTAEGHTPGYKSFLAGYRAAKGGGK